MRHWSRVPSSFVSIRCSDCAAFDCFYRCGYLAAFPFFAWIKATRSQLQTSSPANARAPPLDLAGPSGNLKKVMRTSPLVRKSAVRCPGCSRSDQCSLIFLCGTWMCFFRGWGSADPSTACLSGPNKRGLDPAALFGSCLSVQVQILQHPLNRWKPKTQLTRLLMAE